VFPYGFTVSEKGIKLLPPHKNINQQKRSFFWTTIIGIFGLRVKVDGLVKSRNVLFSVIPAEAGSQYFHKLMSDLAPGFRRGDDFLRDYQG